MRGSGGCSRPPVGSRGKASGRGLGATPQEAEGFFSMSSQKTAFWSMKIRYLQVSELYVKTRHLLGHSQNCTENVILVFKNKIFAKVCNHLTATVRSSPKVGILLKKIL